MLFISKKQLNPTHVKLATNVYLQAFSEQIASWSVLMAFPQSCTCRSNHGIYYACVGNPSNTSFTSPKVLENAHCTWSKNL